MADGLDYHETDKYVLFGHHFAAIAAAGWRILEIECDPKTYDGKITVKDSFIADVYGSTNQPVCAFMSGNFAGYLTDYFGKNISVREISCKVTGKNVCEHAISLAFSGVDQGLKGDIW
jgi:uncharacterized protein